MHLVRTCLLFGEISFGEIKNWAIVTRTPVNGWEAETMMRLRGVYENMKHKARKPGMPQPYVPFDNLQIVHQRVETQFDSLWRSIPRKEKQ